MRGDVVLFLAFLEAPPTPPSLSRLLESRSRASQPFCQQLKDFIASFLEFMRNGYFVLFLIAAGKGLITCGVGVNNMWGRDIKVQRIHLSLYAAKCSD